MVPQYNPKQEDDRREDHFDQEARNYDLRAVNPHARSGEDARTPEELLDIIEARGREVAEALARLRAVR